MLLRKFVVEYVRESKIEYIKEKERETKRERQRERERERERVQVDRQTDRLGGWQTYLHTDRQTD